MGSWNRFLAAHEAYWQKKDQQQQKIMLARRNNLVQVCGRRYATRQYKYRRLFQNVSARSVRSRKLVGWVAAGRHVLEQPGDFLSFPYLNAAYELTAETSLQKFVLVSLANHANPQGKCFPGIDTLARECSMSRSSVIRHLKALEKRKLIETKRTFGRVNHYVLLFQPVSPRHPISSTMKLPPVAPRHPTSSTVTPKPSVNPQIESIGNQKPLSPFQMILLEKEHTRNDAELKSIGHEFLSKDELARKSFLRKRQKLIAAALIVPLAQTLNPN